jgi:hypothetical protein
VDHGRSVVGVKAVVGIVLLAGISLAPTSDASGTCSGPALAVETPRKRASTVRVGAEELVAGFSFIDGCADEEEYPMRNVALSLRQGTEVWDLGVESAGRVTDDGLGRISWQVSIPIGVRRGRALLVAGEAELQVTVAKGRNVDRPARRKLVRPAGRRRTSGR